MRSIAVKIILSLLLIGLLTGVICIGAATWYVFRYVDASLDIDLTSLKMNFTTIIYGIDKETGEPYEMERLHAKQNRIWADYGQIPDNLKNAFIAIEDERFKTHHGVDWKRTLSAVVNYVLKPGSSHGGSTINQQLIKNLTGEDEVRPERKIKEILRALELDKKYTKDEILEVYLNTIALGQGLNGVQTAANTYFGKDVSELTLAECASIAGITQYPTKYNPFINPGYNKERQEIILAKMLELEMISQEEYQAAKDQTLIFAKKKQEEEQTSQQSYFTDQVIEDVIARLVEEKGYSKEIATQMLYSGGLQVYTTMDKDIQAAMDEVYKDPASFPALKGDEQPESAMVIMDPYTGAVLGVVGGRGEKTGARTLNMATQTKRAPGSSIKPLSVYGPAIEYDLITYGSVFDDGPIDLDGKPWPKNQSNKYEGTMTVKRGVQLSINTLPVKIMQILTPRKSYDFMTQNLGITSLVEKKEVGGQIKSDIGLAPLALGGLTDGISVLELTAAYTPFVNAGIYAKPYTFTKVLSHEGKVLLETEPKLSVAMSEQTAFIVHKLLENVVATGTGTRARLASGIPAAGKTGTTENDFDRWFVGYTPYYIGAVWFGYASPREIKGTTSNPSLNAWKLVMDKVHANLAKKAFADPPSKVVQAQYCIDSGGVPTDACKNDPRGSRVETGWFKVGTQPKEPCKVHTPVEICTESNMLAGPYCPAESRKTVSLLNIQRTLPEGVILGDWQYILPAFTTNPDGSVTYEPPVGAPAGEAGMNSVCNIHTQPALPEYPVDPTQPWDPNYNPYDPNNPYNPDYDPNNPQNPANSNNPSNPNNTQNPQNPENPGQTENPQNPQNPWGVFGPLLGFGNGN